MDMNDDYCQVSFSDGTFNVDEGKENYPVVEIWSIPGHSYAVLGFRLALPADQFQ